MMKEKAEKDAEKRQGSFELLLISCQFFIFHTLVSRKYHIQENRSKQYSRIIIFRESSHSLQVKSIHNTHMIMYRLPIFLFFLFTKAPRLMELHYRHYFPLESTYNIHSIYNSSKCMRTNVISSHTLDLKAFFFASHDLCAEYRDLQIRAYTLQRERERERLHAKCYPFSSFSRVLYIYVYVYIGMCGNTARPRNESRVALVALTNLTSHVWVCVCGFSIVIYARDEWIFTWQTFSSIYVVSRVHTHTHRVSVTLFKSKVQLFFIKLWKKNFFSFYYCIIDFKVLL